MRNRKYKLSLRRISTSTASEDDVDFEIKSVEDIKSAVSGLGQYNQLLLCLGPYEIAIINTYSDDFIHLENMLGIFSYSNYEGSGYILNEEIVKTIIGKKITLEEFINLTISEYYQVIVAKNAKEAWELLQAGWKCASRIKRYMNPLLVSERKFLAEKRLIFINRK